MPKTSFLATRIVWIRQRFLLWIAKRIVFKFCLVNVQRWKLSSKMWIIWSIWSNPSVLSTTGNNLRLNKMIEYIEDFMAEMRDIQANQTKVAENVLRYKLIVAHLKKFDANSFTVRSVWRFGSQCFWTLHLHVWNNFIVLAYIEKDLT